MRRRSARACWRVGERTMEDDLFDDLITGVRQMKLIEKGELEPARVTVLKLEKAYLAERATRGNREAFEVTLDLPEEIIEQLREVAQARGMSVRRLLRTLGAKPKRSGPIAVRFEDDTVARLKLLAERKGTGYQTLLKAFVQERLYEEEKREGML